MRTLPGGHFAVRAGAARQGHGVPRAVFQLHRVHGGADQRRSVRHARRRGVLSTPLPTAVRVVIVVAGPATALAAAAAAKDYAAFDHAHHVRPVALPVVEGARLAGPGRWHFFQRLLGRWRRRQRARHPRAHATTAKGQAQKAKTQRLGRHDRQYG